MFAVGAIGTAGCVDMDALDGDDGGDDGDDGDDVCESTTALETGNALSMNALSVNALSMNALSMNALSMNALSTSELIDSAEGRQLLRYLVLCAVPEDVSITTAATNASPSCPGERHRFTGSLGLAPGWLEGAMTTAETERVSACLLAHVNYFETPVTISVRHPQLELSAEEEARFPTHEGAFFGQLFTDETPAMFVCTGKPGPRFDVEYPDHDKSQGDRLLRRCTDSDATDTLCAFEYVGTCKSACKKNPDGTVRDCHGGQGKSGDVYAEAISTWLLAPDDADSVWPTAYPKFYGP